jgi:hypothetical protein
MKKNSGNMGRKSTDMIEIRDRTLTTIYTVPVVRNLLFLNRGYRTVVTIRTVLNPNQVDVSFSFIGCVFQRIFS